MGGSWINIKASESLLAELNIAFPNRDKRSDGSIGDTAHAGSGTSDHLPDEQYAALRDRDADSLPEVHARDIDSDLGRKGWTLRRVFEIIRKRAELGQERRVQNMIVDGQITSATWGWTWRSYGGRDPHDTHGHVSFRYGSGAGISNPENITGPWGILAAVQAEQEKDTDMPLTNDDARTVLAADGIIANRPWRADHPKQGGTNTHISAATALADAMDQAHAARELAGQVGERVEALADVLLTPPDDYANPESHPLVRVLRYVLANPGQASTNG